QATALSEPLARLRCPLCGRGSLVVHARCKNSLHDCLLMSACSVCGFCFGPDQAKLHPLGYQTVEAALRRANCPSCRRLGLRVRFVCDLDKDCALETWCPNCGVEFKIRT
ncbi:MAG: hypothetical protein ACE5HV_13890, partial [Acidobacteriota bacterium]